MSTAILVGAVTAIVVPWFTSAQDTPILGGLLDGRPMPVSFGDHFYLLHWSALVFFVVTGITYLLLRAAEQSG